MKNIEFNPDQMRKLMESDLLIRTMVIDLGNDEEALEAVFYSEVYEDSAMTEAYLNAK